MNKALPPIRESEEALKALLRRESHAQKKQRNQTLYLLKSGQARSRLKVAELLGVHCSTVGEWLQSYESGGLAALLTIGTPPGREPTLDAAQLARLQTALACPEGFASYLEVQAWIADELQVEMPYKTVHHLVRYKLGAKLKRPRPVHVKKNRRPAELPAPAPLGLTLPALHAGKARGAGAPVADG